jgi:hypothetical protein
MPSFTLPLVSDDRWRLAAEWAGLLTGPLVWLGVLEANYVLAYAACETQSTWFMHATIGGALVLVATAGYVGWRVSFDDGLQDRGGATLPSGRTRIHRSRWMGVAGAASSAWFLVVILAMEVPLLVLRPCE